MEGETTEHEESYLIQSAIDKIGEDMREYLSDSIRNIHDASEVFRDQYPRSENSQKYTEDNVDALIRKSMNDGLADLGIRCGPYDTTNPIRAVTAKNFVHLGRDENAPRSPHSRPYSPFTRGVRRGKPFRPRSAPTVHAIRVVRPLSPRKLFGSPPGGGNRTRRRRNRR
jgi:hypothetical protein